MSSHSCLLVIFLSQAGSYVGEGGSFTDDEEKAVKPLRISCWLNGAASCLKLNDFSGAINLCSKVITSTHS